MRLIDDEWVTHEYYKNPSYANLCKVLNNAPTIDAVPVIRCKDCKHYRYADNRALGFPVKRCEWTGFEDVEDTDFCSRGERKGGEDNETD